VVDTLVVQPHYLEVPEYFVLHPNLNGNNFVSDDLQNYGRHHMACAHDPDYGLPHMASEDGLKNYDRLHMACAHGPGYDLLHKASEDDRKNCDRLHMAYAHDPDYGLLHKASEDDPNYGRKYIRVLDLAHLLKRMDGVNEAQMNEIPLYLGFPKKVLYCDLKICVWVRNDEYRPFRFFFS
jgi:hypothetical protein